VVAANEAQASLSIVIPAYRSHTLDAVLDSIEDLRADVLVVDSSPAEPPELDGKAKVCWLPNRTPAGEARNIGARKTRSEFILFLDSDVILTESARAFVLSHLTRPRHDLVCGVYRTDPKVNGLVAALENAVLKYRLLRPRRGRHALVSSSHMLVRRETFERVRGFNPTLKLYEDVEFSARSARLGSTVEVDRDFEAVHLKAFSTWSLLRHYWIKAFCGFIAQRRGSTVFKGVRVGLGYAIGLTWLAGCILPFVLASAIARPGAGFYDWLAVAALASSPVLLWGSVLHGLPLLGRLLSLFMWPIIGWSVASATISAALVWGWNRVFTSTRELVDWIRIGYRTVVRSGMPIQIIHFVTSRCNLRCEHCFYKETLDAPNPGEMSLTTMATTTEEIGPVLWYALAGGEPFLRSDLDEVIDIVQTHCRPKVFSFPTNGWYSDRTFQTTLRALQRMKRGNLIIAFSLDGPEQIHDEIRGEDSYAKVVETMERLRPLKAIYPNLYINVVTTVMPQNAAVAPQFVDQVVKELRPNAISINLFRYHELQHPPLSPDVIEGYEKATEVYKSHVDLGNVEYYGFLGGKAIEIKEFLQKELILRVARDNEFVTPCTAGTLSYVINENGSVAACEILDAGQQLGTIEGTQRSGAALQPSVSSGRSIPVSITPRVGNVSLPVMPRRASTFRELVQSDEAKDLRSWIRDTQCKCTYECAMSTNTFFSWPYAGKLYRGLAKSIFLNSNRSVSPLNPDRRQITSA